MPLFATGSKRPRRCGPRSKRQEWDLVISDYRLPRFDGLAALALVKEKGLDLPFIIVSGYITEETAVAAMKAGAHDYVMKDNLARLGQAVERELREAEVRRERRRAEEALRRVYDELEVRVQERTAELRTANARLKAAIAERQRLEYELLEITEKERRRIGLDLHDDLGQQLSGPGADDQRAGTQAGQAARSGDLGRGQDPQPCPASHDPCP